MSKLNGKSILSVDGLENVIHRFADLPKQVFDESVEAMHDVTDDLLRESRDLAPIDKSTLRKTSFKSVEKEGEAIVGIVSYGIKEEDNEGGHFNYALLMHESRDYTPSTPGTGPKYLERPYKKNLNRYQQWLADAIKRGLERSGR
jgi:hypothetical protein